MNAPFAPVRAATSRNVDDTLAIGGAIARCACAGDVIALDGMLGAGKTQLVRGMAEALGVADGQVSSPTFVMMHEYDTPGDQPVIVHVDAYRITGAADAMSIGLDGAPGSEGFADNAIVVIEWAQRLPTETLGEDVLHVKIDHVDERTRRLILTPAGSWLARAEELFLAIERATTLTQCPTCRAPVSASADTFPFCSARCSTIDLGKWVDGRYRISRPIDAADLDD